MSDTERKICRYFNTLGGCWYGEKCKFIHLLNKKPPCKFFGSSSGCRFGDSCHFSHERTPFKSVENYENGITDDIKEDYKENLNPSELTGTNNNNMEQNLNISATNLEIMVNNTPVSEVTIDFSKESNIANEIEVHCGSCKRLLDKQNNESYCNILKDHYLESFLDKEGDHVKYVKFKAALDPGQMYWCKTCILIFEKPWSLFQHMADKAKGNKVQRWEKKIHLDWLDTVAGLMAGYDLGLFSLGKLRNDLRNLLADQHTIEEEMEVAAVTAAAMMQWLNPATIGNPWRLQQREMMRKIEQLNRQMYRKGGRGVNWGLLTGMGANNFVLGPSNVPGQISGNQNSIVSRGIIKASGDSPEICGLQLLSNESESNLELQENIDLNVKGDYKIEMEDSKNSRSTNSGIGEKQSSPDIVKNDWMNQEHISDLKSPQWDESFSSV
uniref:C3H-zinc finger-containing protein 1 n=1 Tax=Schmidtea mediterranea TaxID=79327 RepID=F9W2W1_SCHMD|nr:TPA_inf: C3H-zinc finger-containing protein 1 [Schmidtea mediterranea]